MAFPEAKIYSLNHTPVKQVDYDGTEYYKIYKGFMEDRVRAANGKWVIIFPVTSGWALTIYGHALQCIGPGAPEDINFYFEIKIS